jgi:hypothetical protein
VSRLIEYWTDIEDDNLSHVDKMSHFLQSEFGELGADRIWSPEYFKWKLGRCNPAGKGYVSLAMIGEQVVGSISLTKKRILIDGKECLGAEIGDSYSSVSIRRRGKPLYLSKLDVNPKSYINRSVFGRLVSDVQRRAERDGVSVIYGSPNVNSYAGYTKNLNFIDADWCNNVQFIRPTCSYFKKRYASLRFLTPIFQIIEKVLVLTHSGIYSRFLNRGVVFECALPSEEMINDLWGRLKPVLGFSLIRDASYWSYRYINHPIFKYSFFKIYKNNILEGIVVTRLHVANNGRKIVSIAEWLVEDGIKFDFILLEIVNHYRKSSVDYFNFWADKSSKEGNAAKRSLFFTRQKIPIIFSSIGNSRLFLSKKPKIEVYLGNTDNV